MKKNIKVVSIVGTRPQFIKLAPVCRAVRKFPALKHIIVHTGQHYDYAMSKIFFDELMLPRPDYHLEAGSARYQRQTALMISRIERALIKEQPDWVLVYGDTDSTLAGAIAAAKKCIPVAHVEAGLRSFNTKMPEEVNRRLTDTFSSLLLCPTVTAVRNLRREGMSCVLNDGTLRLAGGHRKRYPIVANVGDIMYDAYLFSIKIAQSSSDILSALTLNERGYYLATIHRAENADSKERLGTIIRALAALAADKPVIFPVHLRTRKMIRSLSIPRRFIRALRCIDPVGYFDMLMLEKNAGVILTDSGGVQKEAFFARVPCVTLRDETEWGETVKAGWNVLAGVDEKRIRSIARKAHRGRGTVDFGDGRTSQKILRFIEKL
ncbi:MAG: UDP-N-acetylglucosamine 2-epimerase (non-hydrolyzing) [Candidatus Omnitrophica bacterium]|nr:UDP-N-acetylglucosamine 2-epimerase (non-hydrolyzing) [Candidatus Omnitrophota bacterium]